MKGRAERLPSLRLAGHLALALVDQRHPPLKDPPAVQAAQRDADHPGLDGGAAGAGGGARLLGLGDVQGAAAAEAQLVPQGHRVTSRSGKALQRQEKWTWFFDGGCQRLV